MSTSKEQQRRQEEEGQLTAQERVHQREQQQSINKSLDETKNNIRRATDEARKDIPHYTHAVNEYQEETISSRQMADNYLESQREIINSMQSALLPQIEAANRVVTKLDNCKTCD